MRRRGQIVRALSWSLPVPDGAYASIRCWNNRDSWLATLEATLHSPAGDAVRRKISVAPDTLMRVAGLDAASAETRTGRSVTTAHETVANTLGLSKRQVQRAREVIRLLGFAQIVVEGRYLTTSERAAAYELHGHQQIKAASIRALTIPAHITQPVNVHLPRKGLRSTDLHSYSYSPTRAQAREAATRPESKEKNHSTKNRKTRYSPAVFAVADELAQRLPFLSDWRTLVTDRPGEKPLVRWQGNHLGSICRVLMQSGIDLDRFSGRDVIEIFDRITQESGLATMTSSFVKNPLGYLTTLLKRAAAYIEYAGYRTKHERYAAAAARRLELQTQQARAKAEREAEHARANTPEAIAAREAFFAAHRARTQKIGHPNG